MSNVDVNGLAKKCRSLCDWLVVRTREDKSSDFDEKEDTTSIEVIDKIISKLKLIKNHLHQTDLWKFIDYNTDDVNIIDDNTALNNSNNSWRTVLFGNEFPIGETVINMKITNGYCVGIGFVPKHYKKLRGGHIYKDSNSIIVYYDGDSYINGKSEGFGPLKFNKDKIIKITVTKGEDWMVAKILNTCDGKYVTFELFDITTRLGFELGSKGTQIKAWLEK